MTTHCQALTVARRTARALYGAAGTVGAVTYTGPAPDGGHEYTAAIGAGGAFLPHRIHLPGPAAASVAPPRLPLRTVVRALALAAVALACGSGLSACSDAADRALPAPFPTCKNHPYKQ